MSYSVSHSMKIHATLFAKSPCSQGHSGFCERSVSAPLPSSRLRRVKRSANTGVALVVSVCSGFAASLAAGVCEAPFAAGALAGHVAAFHSFTVWSPPPAQACSWFDKQADCLFLQRCTS